MVKTIILSFTALFTSFMSAQNFDQSVKVGDQFIISQPISDTYKHIDFPRKNIIIKRGAIADFKSLNGMKVILTDITYSKNQNPIITLQRADGRPFFRFFNSVKADLNQALEREELKLISK